MKISAKFAVGCPDGGIARPSPHGHKPPQRAVLARSRIHKQAGVEGATVELRFVGTNEVHTQTTNSAGEYSFSG
jgi:hypothetical protein